MLHEKFRDKIIRNLSISWNEKLLKLPSANLQAHCLSEFILVAIYNNKIIQHNFNTYNNLRHLWQVFFKKWPFPASFSLFSPFQCSFKNS